MHDHDGQQDGAQGDLGAPTTSSSSSESTELPVVDATNTAKEHTDTANIATADTAAADAVAEPTSVVF